MPPKAAKKRKDAAAEVVDSNPPESHFDDQSEPAMTKATDAETAPTEPVSIVAVVKPATPIKVNLDDQSVIKHVLDEHAARAVVAAGYDEDQTFSNMKLLLGVVAILIAAVANLKLHPLTESKPFIVAAVASYFLLSLAIQFMYLLLPKDCVLVTKPKRSLAANVAADQSLDPIKKRALLKSKHALVSPAIVVTASLERYTTDYHLTIKQRRSSVGAVTRTLQITDFFDVTGVFIKDRFTAAITAVVGQFQSQSQPEAKRQ